MKATWIIIGGTLILAAGVVVFTTTCDADWCRALPWRESPTVATINSFEDCVKAGNPVSESYPRQCIGGGKTFTEQIGNESEKNDLIRIQTPRPSSAIESPLTIEGEARGNWFFEASFPIVLFDANDEELGRAVAHAEGESMTTTFVPFKATLRFTPPTTEKGTLVLQKDNPSGLPENDDALRVPITFKTTATAENTTTLKVFFGSRKLDPDGLKCETTYAAERRIAKTDTPARSALEELLAGPTNAEAQQEFFTSINSDVKIQSLTIVNDVAKVDFDSMLELSVGGSCRVAAIRSQITNTLKQFSTVASVIISINGKTEGVLQP